MENHVPIKRLVAVAVADHLIFTSEEFNHLKECSGCFATWAEFIGQFVREGELIMEKAKQSPATTEVMCLYSPSPVRKKAPRIA